MDFFNVHMQQHEIDNISVLGLAHVGDGVYELLTRSMLCQQGHLSVGELHRETVARVNASAQSAAVKRILPLLSDEEHRVYKRGRNTRVNSVPSHADLGEYHAATGLECLFGWLFLRGERERLEQLYSAIAGEGDDAT